MEFKGKIKTLITKTYKAEVKFGEMVKGAKIYLIWQYEYDIKGNKIKEYRFETDGQLNEKRTYSYNEFNDRTEKKVFDENENLHLHKLYKYDGNECTKFVKLRTREFSLDSLCKTDNIGNRIEKAEYASSGKMIGVYKYQYDRKNNCIEEIRYKYDGNLDFIVKNKYDKNGNQIQIKTLNSDGSLDNKSKYEYDDNSNCTKMSYYKSDNSLDNVYVFKYDFHGNVIKSKQLNSQGVLIFSKEKFEYQYDRVGNWISLISYRKNKNEIWTPFEFKESTFEYHNGK